MLPGLQVGAVGGRNEAVEHRRVAVGDPRKDSGLRRGLPRGTPKSSCSRLEGQSKRRRNFKCLMATISSRTALIQDPTKTKPLVAPFLLIELVPMFCPHNPTL